MKIKTIAFALITSLCLSFTAASVSAHGEEKAKKSVGPNGGRVLNGITPRAEFFITPDRMIQITFLDDQGQPIAPAGQTVVVTAGQRSAPSRLSFSIVDNVLLSDLPVPSGKRVPTVVQITSLDGKTVFEKLNVNLTVCSGCENPEYACICVGH